MKPQKGRCRAASAFLQRAWPRALGDAEQQTDHQIGPQQSAELLGELTRTAVQKSRRPSPGHDLAQGGIARFPSYGIESLRHLRRTDGFGDRETEYRDDRRLADLA